MYGDANLRGMEVSVDAEHPGMVFIQDSYSLGNLKSVATSEAARDYARRLLDAAMLADMQKMVNLMLARDPTKD